MLSMTEAQRRAEFAGRLKSVFEVDIAGVLDTIGYLRDANDCVIMAGSLAFGLGNRLSDLDCIIAGGKTTHSSRVPLQHWMGKLRIDVWKLSAETVNRVYLQAKRAVESEEEMRGQFLEEEDLKLLYRTAYGFHWEGAAMELVVTHDFLAVARDLIMRKNAEISRNAAFIAGLAARHGSLRAAAWNARIAVEAAVQAAIVSAGLPYVGLKWIYEQLPSGAPEIDELVQAFRRLPDANFERYVADAIGVGEHLLGTPLGLDKLSGQVRFESGEISPMKLGADTVLLSARENALLRLDRNELTTWRKLDSRGRVDVAVAALDATQLAMCWSLLERGWLELVWTVGLPLSATALVKES